MKKLYIFLFFYPLLYPLLCTGQNPKQPPGKGTANKPLMLAEVGRDTCLNKVFSVVFYLIQDSTGAKNIAAVQSNEIPIILNALNTYFARICVSFSNCSTAVIPNHEYNKWTQIKVDKDVTDVWYTPKTINIYLVEELITAPDDELTGYAHAPSVPGAKFSNKDVMVFQYTTIPPDKKDHALLQNGAGINASAVVHVAGHFFGLPDTFSELLPPNPQGTNELVRRNNCDFAGDGICDTEADPWPIHFYPPPNPPPKGTYCYYWPVTKDANGDYYTPPVDNFMSLYNCRCRFSQQQYNMMARYIIKNRWYLH